MNTPSATKQYVINQLPDSAGDITLNSIVGPSGLPGTTTLWWYSTGKLIFGIFATDIGGNVLLFSDVGGTIGTTCDQLAVLMGVPSINTYYTNIHCQGGTFTYSYHGGTWHSNLSTGGDQGLAIQFLTN